MNKTEENTITERITAVEIYKAQIELKEPFRTSLAEIKTTENIFVRLYSSSGLYGMGEARPNPVVTGETQETAFATAYELSKAIIGLKPAARNTIAEIMERKLKKNSAAKSAIDIAVWDLVGKLSGMPLYSLLGGSRRAIYTDNTVSFSDPREMAEKARAHKKAGFRAIKLKLGGNKEEDIERVRRVREEVGQEIDIRLDANQGWDLKSAVYILERIKEYRIQYCEQPLLYWNERDMRRLRDVSSIPIMADETLFGPSDAFRLAAEESCDYFNIKLTKAGGLSNGLKIVTIGESADIPCMIGCMTETRLALSAGAHLMSARENIRFADLDGFTEMKFDPIQGGVQYEKGDMHLLDTPGLGADVDQDFLSSCEMQRVE